MNCGNPGSCFLGRLHKLMVEIPSFGGFFQAKIRPRNPAHQEPEYIMESFGFIFRAPWTAFKGDAKFSAINHHHW